MLVGKGRSHYMINIIIIIEITDIQHNLTYQIESVLYVNKKKNFIALHCVAAGAATSTAPNPISRHPWINTPPNQQSKWMLTEQVY